MKDGVHLEKDINKNIYNLTIPKIIQTTHTGKLIVRATNTIGTTEHEIQIFVDGKLKFFFQF